MFQDEMGVRVEAPKISFVTGGNGFVGTALKDFLAGQGWVVKTDPLRLLEQPEKWREVLTGVSSVVHLAAHVHQLGGDPSRDAAYTTVNVEGSRFVAEQAVRAGVRRFVFLSSVKVNGEGREQPYTAEEDPHPSGAYGVSKLRAECAVREVCKSGDVQCVIIRPPLVYGPGVRANFRRIMQWVDRGLPLPFKSIHNQRSLISLSNLVSFIQTCMVHSRAPVHTWLIADDEPMSTPQLVQRIAYHLKRSPRLYAVPPSWLKFLARPLGFRDEVSRLCDSLIVDASPARTDLGWTPIVTFDEELARTVAAFKAGRAR